MNARMRTVEGLCASLCACKIAHVRMMRETTNEGHAMSNRIDKACGIALIGIVPLSLSLSLSYAYSQSPLSPSHGPSSVSVFDDELPDMTADPASFHTNRDDAVLIHDPELNTFTVYPDSLPPCDDEDGTATSNNVPVAACAWDDGSGRSFIIIAP